MAKKRLLWLALFLLGVMLSALWGLEIKYWNWSQMPCDIPIGNKSASYSALKEAGMPFSFLVLSDTHVRATSEALIKKAIDDKKNDAFMIHVGDVANKTDIWDRRFFITEMAIKIRPPFPVFLTAGNHDIDYARKIKNPDRDITPEVYETLNGPRDYSFVFNNCLFIICDGDGRCEQNYLSFLSDTLSKNAEGKKHIFVFTHFPPRGLDGRIEQMKKACLPEETKFYALMEKYKVTSCFFGHYHGYFKRQINGVNYIITGGGGGRLDPGNPPNYHEMLRITVGPDKMDEEIITSPARSNLGYWVENNSFLYVLPLIQTAPWMRFVIMLILLAFAAFSAYRVNRKSNN
jgi:3',5'-cyclic-AMP phosphodiesterase